MKLYVTGLSPVMVGWTEAEPDVPEPDEAEPEEVEPVAVVDNVPSTGDNTSLLVWMMLLLFSGVGLIKLKKYIV